MPYSPYCYSVSRSVFYDGRKPRVSKHAKARANRKPIKRRNRK